MVTSVYSMGSAPSLLSMVRVTSARPSGGREAVPAKTTSSILPPRRVLTPCSPITQENASTTLDLPDPLGPTTQVIPGSKRSVVADANDLNPRRVRVFRYTCRLPFPAMGSTPAVCRTFTSAGPTGAGYSRASRQVHEPGPGRQPRRLSI